MIEKTALPVTVQARRTKNWRAEFAARLVVTDFLVLVWVVFGVQIAWLGLEQSAFGFSPSQPEVAISYTLISIVIVLGWMGVLSFYGTRGYRTVGAGTQEYKLIIDGALRLFGLVAIVAFLFKIDFARGYILMALPLGVAVLLFSRWMWRQWLGVQRLHGGYSSTVLLVGSESSVIAIARELLRNASSGYRIVGACIPSGRVADYLPGTEVPVMGNVERALEALEVSGADTVVLTSSDELSPERVRRLSWGLEPGRQHLVVAPSLVDIGGPRIHTRPVAGLPLIHVETPRYDGGKNFMKRASDVVLSCILLTIVSPLIGAIAVIVRLSSPGPVLFRQERVGLGGEKFMMLKFRSMVSDAESQLSNLMGGQSGAGNDVLFKMKDDPRVTAVGAFLRRFSLDELPQLVNVLLGSMSLVGPRPPLEREVSAYEAHVHRRFLVKPGITGLWQVSGRSDLSWEDSVRLDLYYVENWSITGDLIILWRTFRAVIGRSGAY